MTPHYIIYIIQINFNKNQIYLSNSETTIVLTAAVFKKLLKTPAVIFSDLSTYGLHLLEFFQKEKIKPKEITAYDLSIHAIYFTKVVIKNCGAFNFKINENNFNTSWSYLNKINTYLNINLKTSLYDYKITSLASISIALLKLYKCPAFIEYDDKIEEFVRKAFFGGRCELFNPGFYTELWYYDFPSMYGNTLKTKFPLEFKSIKKITHLTEIENGFIEATVNQHAEMRLPLLPKKSINGTYYTTGVFKGVFWKEELMFFLENGGEIVTLHQGLEVLNFCTIFEPLVTILLDLKEKKCPFAKPLLNGIYGRLAMKTQSTKTTICERAEIHQLIKKNFVKKYVYYNNLCLFEKPLKKKNPHKNIIIGAIIPARARIKLLQLVFKTLEIGATLIYIDTDSLFVNIEPIKITYLLKLEKFLKTTDNTFFTEKNYKFYFNNVLEQRGEEKSFFKSFKRKNTNTTTRPFLITEVTH